MTKEMAKAIAYSLGLYFHTNINAYNTLCNEGKDIQAANILGPEYHKKVDEGAAIGICIK